MEQHPAKLRLIQHIAHDVLQTVIQKRPNNNFTPVRNVELILHKVFGAISNKEFRNLPGDNFVNVLSVEKAVESIGKYYGRPINNEL